jgi:hypothetical protein
LRWINSKNSLTDQYARDTSIMIEGTGNRVRLDGVSTAAA